MEYIVTRRVIRDEHAEEMRIDHVYADILRAYDRDGLEIN